MPSLKVAWILRTRSFSSIPSTLMKLVIGGIVDSPTPIVPISADSTSRMRQPSFSSSFARLAAAIQPAVPPPTMAILRIGATGTVEISDAGAAVNSSHYGTPSGRLVRISGHRDPLVDLREHRVVERPAYTLSGTTGS